MFTFLLIPVLTKLNVQQSILQSSVTVTLSFKYHNMLIWCFLMNKKLFVKGIYL